MNPILAGDYSDPAVLKEGQDYYMSHSMCGGMKFLRVVNCENVITLFWSDDGKQWTQSKFAHEVSGYHHNVFNGYAGLRVALYATGAGSVRFNDFRYRGLENEV